MKRLSKINKADWHFVPVDPEPGFDPEHNKRVIEETIKKNDLKFKKDQEEYFKETKERTEALAMFIKNLDMGRGESDINKYFGKKELVRLRGEQIMQKLRSSLIYRNSQGKLLRTPEQV